MLERIGYLLLQVSWVFACAGCVPLSNVKIPLSEISEPTSQDSPRITIDDHRRPRDREPHLAKNIMHCERWFGDDTFQPPKLAFLEKELAGRTPADTRVHVRLTRFDITEYCEHTLSASATADAAAAGTMASEFNPAPVVGDTVVMRIAGEVNGTPFDVSQQFDFGTLYTSPNIPSSSPRYRALLRARLDDMISDIAGIVWRARSASQNGR